MTEQWQELKDTIIELRDNDGTSIQQELCTFLVNYMDILEKQIQEPCGNAISRQAVLDIVDSYSESQSNVEDVTQDIISDIMALPSVNPQPKIGHWKRISMDRYTTHAQYWYKCDKCGEHNLGNTDYCPSCGAKMVEPQESEV
ncbi:MAG: zinc ribbon domain-containing protein [Parasporobacterium sp.]|nr:zinc ribbon domain-containing protein [Parasporobacterium sp.]